MGAATHLLKDEHDGQVFIHGLLTHAWEPGDEAPRRFAADIATVFGISPATLWHWKATASAQGLVGLISEKRGPKGNSKLTGELISNIHQVKAQGLSNHAAAQQAGVSEFRVRRALKLDPATEVATTAACVSGTSQATIAPV